MKVVMPQPAHVQQIVLGLLVQQTVPRGIRLRRRRLTSLKLTRLRWRPGWRHVIALCDGRQVALYQPSSPSLLHREACDCIGMSTLNQMKCTLPQEVASLECGMLGRWGWVMF